MPDPLRKSALAHLSEAEIPYDPYFTDLGDQDPNIPRTKAVPVGEFLAETFTPYGDVVAAKDAYDWYQDPKRRTALNTLAVGLGLLPLVPPLAATGRRGAEALMNRATTVPGSPGAQAGKLAFHGSPHKFEPKIDKVLFEEWKPKIGRVISNPKAGWENPTEPAHISIGSDPRKTDWKIGDERVFYRSGSLPKTGRSFNYRENVSERGVSVYPLPDPESFAGFGDKPWFLGKGRVVGVGSDGEPLIEPMGKWTQFASKEEARNTDTLARKAYEKLTALYPGSLKKAHKFEPTRENPLGKIGTGEGAQSLRGFRPGSPEDS